MLQMNIDLTKVSSAEELHSILRDTLGFPAWYGCNWDAFWDAITGLVQMPAYLRFSGWESFSIRLPRDAKLLQECLADLKIEFPELAPDVEFN